MAQTVIARMPLLNRLRTSYDKTVNVAPLGSISAKLSPDGGRVAGSVSAVPIDTALRDFDAKTDEILAKRRALLSARSAK